MYLLGVVGLLLGMVVSAYKWVIIIQAVLSFVNPDPYNPIIQFLHKITAPAYDLVRKKSPFNTYVNGIDLSPMIIIFGLLAIELIVVVPLSRFYI